MPTGHRLDAVGSVYNNHNCSPIEASAICVIVRLDDVVRRVIPGSVVLLLGAIRLSGTCDKGMRITEEGVGGLGHVHVAHRVYGFAVTAFNVTGAAYGLIDEGWECVP